MQPGIVTMIYHTQGEYANHYTTDAGTIQILLSMLF
jgi:hypothetical protein